MSLRTIEKQSDQVRRGVGRQEQQAHRQTVLIGQCSLPFAVTGVSQPQEQLTVFLFCSSSPLPDVNFRITYHLQTPIHQVP